MINLAKQNINYYSLLYLTKKNVAKEEWFDLIKSISKINGFLKKWQLIININQNEITYYTKTNFPMPATLDNHFAFLFHKNDEIKLEKVDYELPFYTSIGSDLLNILDKCHIKKKGLLTKIVIDFLNINSEKILGNVYLYILKNNKTIKYKLFLGNYLNILSIDFSNNKRFITKSSPKYLDINKTIHLLSSDKTNSLFSIDPFPYLNDLYYLNEFKYDFAKHSIIFGASGCGKSKFICSYIYNIYKNIELKNNYRVVVIDPHAALENDIGGLAKVIDFKNYQSTIDLFINDNKNIVSKVELLLDMLKSLIKDQYNSKLERVLRHSIYLLLVKENFNFSSLKSLLLDLEYRNNLIAELKNEVPFSIIEFFLSDFNELKNKSYGEAISPIISFIDEMEMVPVFNQKDFDSNLKETINNNFLTIFSLNRIELGDNALKTIASLIMEQLLTLIESYAFKEHIIFIIDEVPLVENNILCRFLSEARKYNLSLILAGQYFKQISNEVKSAIFANTINYYLFRLPLEDAHILAEVINMKIPLEDTIERKVKILSELNNRECIIRISENDKLMPAMKTYTTNYTSIPKKEVIIEKREEKDPKENKFSFRIQSSISLKDILKSNSSSRKVVK